MCSCITIFCFQYTIEEIRSTSGRLPIPQLPEESAHKPVDIVRRHFDLSVGDACAFQSELHSVKALMCEGAYVFRITWVQLRHPYDNCAAQLHADSIHGAPRITGIRLVLARLADKLVEVACIQYIFAAEQVIVHLKLEHAASPALWRCTQRSWSSPTPGPLPSCTALQRAACHSCSD